MKLSNAIKRGAVAVQAAIAPHENPAPVEGTQAATIQPAAPSEERDLQEAHANALRIVESLTRQSREEKENAQYGIDEGTRKAIIYSLNRYGPPKPQFEEYARGTRKHGEYRAFDGSVVDSDRTEERPERVANDISLNAVKSDHE